MIALLSQWKTLGLGALCLLLAALVALWRIETGRAQKLAQDAAAARTADRMDQAKAAAGQDAAQVIGAAADRDQHTLTLHMENSHALEAASGYGQSLDPDLNAAGRRGLCGFAAYAGDPACAQLRGPDPAGRPQARGRGGAAAR